MEKKWRKELLSKLFLMSVLKVSCDLIPKKKRKKRKIKTVLGGGDLVFFKVSHVLNFEDLTGMNLCGAFNKFPDVFIHLKLL